MAGASPGVRQLEKSPFPNLRLLFRKGATLCRWSPCHLSPPPHTKRSLESNTHFTFQALPSSVLKLETSCQKEKCCQGPSDTSWLFGFWPRVHARAWSRDARFDCFFITCSIFGIFQLFLDLDISADSNEENEYRHSIVGLAVWSGRSFLCFKNVIS